MAGKDKEREERLAAALRENLRRRKAQTRKSSDGENPDAQFRLGMELLADPDGREWQKGVALIEAAAAAGHAAASERCAVFECMGIGRPPDWNKAVERLQQAADQGSEAARSQLALLAGRRFEVRASAPRQLLGRPLILTIEQVASAAECQWLIAAASRRLEPSYVHDSATGRFGVDPNRTNLGATFPIVETDLVLEMIRQRIAAAIHSPTANFEVPQVLRYLVGQEFKPHYDYLDTASEAFRAEVARNGQPVATVLVYLNEDFEGGETDFPQVGFRYRCRTGDALVFSNVDPVGQQEPAALHAGVPPTKGEKWVLSQWVRDRPPGSGG